MFARHLLRQNNKVVVGVSGGVDSSVAALLVRNHLGRDNVTGVFIRSWDSADEQGSANPCTIQEDLISARNVCGELGIEFREVDLVKEYWNRVFQPYLEAFTSGGTPNADVFCNREVKFNMFRQYVQTTFGHETYIATGHYARLGVNPIGIPKYNLLESVDKGKDQSYFLSCVPGEALHRCLFPVGDLHKTQVRKIAQENGLSTYKRKDSVGICFVGRRKFDKFIGDYLDLIPGDMVDVDSGKVVAQHSGIHLYTIGQKAKVGGMDQKLYVVSKDMENNRVYVAQGDEHPALYSTGATVKAKEIFWIAGGAPKDQVLQCRVRYRQEKVDCKIETCQLTNDVVIHFAEPQKAVTSKQIIAFYKEEVCLGGGVIDSCAS